MQGPQGPIGPHGPTGILGATGFQGFRGPMGVNGERGMTGAQGVQGIRGYPGPSPTPVRIQVLTGIDTLSIVNGSNAVQSKLNGVAYPPLSSGSSTSIVGMSVDPSGNITLPSGIYYTEAVGTFPFYDNTENFFSNAQISSLLDERYNGTFFATTGTSNQSGTSFLSALFVRSPEHMWTAGSFYYNYEFSAGRDPALLSYPVGFPGPNLVVTFIKV